MTQTSTTTTATPTLYETISGLIRYHHEHPHGVIGDLTFEGALEVTSLAIIAAVHKHGKCGNPGCHCGLT